jgi:hypothetical protein
MSNAATETEKPEKIWTTTPKKLRQTIYWLALDWIGLHRDLPTPPKGETTRTSNAREYGHPAEWASDKAREIVDKLTSWHDMLAEHRHETPPPAGSEQRRLIAAWTYLDPRTDKLIELIKTTTSDGRENHIDLKELADLHGGIRNILGHNKPRYMLPVPCPNTDCGLRTLERVVGIGADYIACGHCEYVVRDDPEGRNYKWLIRVCIDTLIGDAENPQTVLVQ